MLQERRTRAGLQSIRLALVSAALLFVALVVQFPGAAAAQSEVPNVTVSYAYWDEGWRSIGIDGDGFSPNVAVEARILAAGGTLLWSGSFTTDDGGAFGHCCVVPELVDLDVTAGMRVVVRDPLTGVAKEVVLVDLAVDEVDPVADVVSGTAPPGSEVFVTEPEGSLWTETVAGADGGWAVDLGALGVDASWLTPIVAGVWDADGDTVTALGSPATIRANLTNDVVSGAWFSLAASVAVEVLDAGGATLWAGSAATGDVRSFFVGPETHGLELAPGMRVRVTDPVAGFTKELTIVPLTIDVLDPAADLVAGTAAPNTAVRLWVWFPGEGGGEVADVPVDAAGAWSYDFATGGPDPIDIRSDTIAGVYVADAEADATTAEITATPGAIAGLRSEVAGLVAAGELTAVQAAPLVKKLDDALGKLDEGKLDAAVGKLRAFVEKVRALVGSRRLSATSGGELIERANAIIRALEAT